MVRTKSVKKPSQPRSRSSGIISPLWFQHPHPYTDPFYLGALMSQASSQASTAPPQEDSYSDSYSSDDTRSPSPPPRKPRAAIQKSTPKKAPARKPAAKKAPVQFKTKNGKQVSFTPTGKRQQKKKQQQEESQPVPTQADEDNDMIIYSDKE